MNKQDLLLQALRSFASAMGSSYDLDEMSHQLGERVTEALGVAGAGVSVAAKSGDLEFVTATSAVIVEIEEIQQATQEGPCVTALRSQRPVLVGNISELDNWPTYKETALSLSLGAVVGYPMIYEGQSFGALNIYAGEPRGWTAEEVDVIGVFADMATAYLVRSSQLAESRVLAGQLQNALDSRVLIEQAKGVLANEHRISVDEAFEHLRRYSQNENRKLTDVAQAVIGEGLQIPVGELDHDA